jgi:hypothetical protein
MRYVNWIAVTAGESPGYFRSRNERRFWRGICKLVINSYPKKRQSNGSTWGPYEVFISMIITTIYTPFSLFIQIYLWSQLNAVARVTWCKIRILRLACCPFQQSWSSKRVSCIRYPVYRAVYCEMPSRQLFTLAGPREYFESK